MLQFEKSPSAKKAVFIVDAAHAIEEKLLLEWIEAQPFNEFYQDYQIVIIPIASNPDHIDSEPLKSILINLGNSDELIDFVPIRVVWKTSLDEPHTRPRFRDLLAGNQRRPGRWLAQRIMERWPERAQCIAGAPATLAKLSADHQLRNLHHAGEEQLQEYICNQAALALDVGERRFRGVRYRVPRRIVANLLADPDFRAELSELARQKNTSVEKLLEDANPIFKELIPKPVNFWQDTLAVVQRSIVSMGYDREIKVDRDRLQELKNLSAEKPTVLLWTHKTHVDGFAVASLLFEEDFPATHTIGGVNMAFAGLGFLGRKTIAIFIRRSFTDDNLYKLILRFYLGYLLKKRFPLTWAFEGTRSRVGKLMPPRYGILKYVVEAAQSQDLEELHIVPVSINYDLINDVRDYVAEQGGAIKTPESLRWFISYLRRFKSSHGKIYVDFGKPVSVSAAVATETSLDIAKIAFEVGVEANRVSPITLTSLVVFILLGITPRAVTKVQLEKQLNDIVRWADERNIVYTDELKPENYKERLELGTVIIDSGLVSRYDQGPDTVFAISEEQQGIAGYYRNTIVHHFITKAIAELALLNFANEKMHSIDEFWTTVDELRDLFKFEFFYAPSDEFRTQLDNELKRYDSDWQTKLVNEKKFARTFLNSLTPYFSHTALLPFIEAYCIVAGIFARLPANETIEAKTCVAQALRFGRQAHLQSQIRSRASIGKLLFENGYKLLDSRGLVAASSIPTGSVDEKNDPTRMARRQFSRELWSLAHRIATIRTMASPGDIEY